MTPSARPRLVVLRALKLGDFLTGIPAMRALRRHFPDHRGVLCAPAPFGPLLSQTGMDEIHDTFDLAPLGAGLHGAEVAVDLHGRGPESQRLLQAVHPERLISFRHHDVAGTSGFPVWRPDEHEVHRWCRMLVESGVPADPTDLRLDPSVLPPSPAPGATLIHPGAASEARRWPADRFAAVARAESAAGYRVLITGGAAERELAHRVATLAGLPESAVLAGSTSLLELAGLVASAARVVSGDTGVAHMATATGTPSVVLFGPVPPAEWGPPPGSLHVALWAGHRGDPHADQIDPGLLEISVDRVLDALSGLPRRPPPVDGAAVSPA